MSDKLEIDTIPNDVNLKASIIPGDRYEVVGLLGSGGFAEVYEAFDKVIHRPVAIKILNSISGSGQDAKVMLERFNREARASAAIRHPNVVAIYDMGVLNGDRPYIVMEKLTGHDFEDEIAKKGGMSPRRLMPLFIKALDALGEGHKQGIIHKDLKPANLFLVDPGTEREDVRVVDFGIARIGGKDASLTGTGQILGTPRYIAPEYVRTQDATPAVDVYQMGLILIEMLTGKPVVDSDNPMECLMIHANGDLSVPMELLNGPLGPAIARALQQEPEARFANAGEFKVAIEGVSLDTLPESYALTGAMQSISAVSASHNQVASDPSQNPDTGRFGAGSPDSGHGLLRDYVTTSGTLNIPTDKRASGGSGKALKVALGLAAGLALLAVLILGVVFGVMHLGDKDNDASKKTAEVEAPEKKAKEDPPKPKEIAKADPEDDTEAKDEPEEVKAPPEDLKAKVVTIDSDPPKAEVRQGDTFLGRTPFKVIFAPGDGESRSFVITKRGYLPEGVEIGPDQDSPQTARLTKGTKQTSKKPRKVAKKTTEEPVAKKTAEAPVEKKPKRGLNDLVPKAKKKPAGKFDDLVPKTR